MDQKELRLGNYVCNESGYIFEVARIETKEYTEWDRGDEYSVICKKFNTKDVYHEGKWSPIRLTVDWLLNLGFKKREGNNNCYDLNEFTVCWYGNKFATWLIQLKQENNNLTFHSKIEHVHQLQNTYYELTYK